MTRRVRRSSAPAIWVAIGALIAAAIVCVIWVLVGTQNGIIGRAFLTILLLAAFAGVAIIDANLADRRPAWFALASMVTWVITLLIGAGHDLDARALLVGWIQSGSSNSCSSCSSCSLFCCTSGSTRRPNSVTCTTFTQIVTIVTIVLVIGLAIMLVLPLMLGEWVDFLDLYWRFVVALTILAAVGTALIPLINALFAPKKPRPAYLDPPPVAPAQALPALADVRRRGDPAPGDAGRLTGLERLLHGVPVSRSRRRSRRSLPSRRPRRSGTSSPRRETATKASGPRLHCRRDRSALSAAAPRRPSPRCGRRCRSPRRRAVRPEPHSSTRGCSVATPPALRGGVEPVLILGPRPRQQPVEDVAADHAQ
jgi:hypothetical protein